MTNSPVLKEYYIRYLYGVRGLSKSSVSHYVDALNNISRFLIRKKLMESSIFTIGDIEYLEHIREILFADPEFIAQDQRGHQMYSAGLNNYCRFAKGEYFSTVKEKHISVDIPILAKESAVLKVNRQRRSSIIRKQSIEMANYSCEIDNEHESFIAESSHRKYMEGHHAIPTYQQNHFEYSLDVYANIICLCPLCHRRIHYGLKQDRISMLQQIYDVRSERLAQSGIYVSRNDFVALSMEKEAM